MECVHLFNLDCPLKFSGSYAPSFRSFLFEYLFRHVDDGNPQLWFTDQHLDPVMVTLPDR